MGRRQDEQWDALMRLAQGQAKTLGPAFLRLVENLKGNISLARLQDLLTSAGGPDAVAQALAQDTAVWNALQDTLHTVLANVAIAQAGNLPPSLVVAFDRYNPRAVEVMQREGAALVREITDSFRAGIREIATQGLQLGENPRQTARMIRDGLGLTDRQARAVGNFRQLLLNGDRQVFERALRDKRYDKTLERALRGGVSLPAEKVDAMVAAYQRRYLIYRSETIARTEAINALSAGGRLAWEQAIHDGKVARRDLLRDWFVSRDERTCPVCSPIPAMNKGGVAFDQPFATPNGPVMGPTMHPDCRCVVLTKPT